MDSKEDVKALIKGIISASQADTLINNNEDVKSRIQDLTAVSLWSLLDLPNLSLKNSLNKCWFHSGLHYWLVSPACVPCLSLPQECCHFWEEIA